MDIPVISSARGQSGKLLIIINYKNIDNILQMPYNILLKTMFNY